MAQHANTGIVTNGLVFAYDMDSRRSYTGEPTTNHVGSAASMAGWGSYDQGNDGTFLTEFGTTGYRMNSRGSWNGINKGITVPSTGTYTLSAYIRYWGGSGNNNGAAVYCAGYGGGDVSAAIDKSLIGQWQRISLTINATNTSFTFYIISYGGTVGSDHSTWEVTMPQVNAGSYATPFTNSSRSNTQAILDLTGNNTVTASSLTYNSDDTFSFTSANSNYITLGNDTNLIQGSKISVEAWVRTDQIGSYRKIFTNGNALGTYLSLGPSGFNTYFGVVTDGSSGTATWNNDIRSNTMTHMVGTYDGSTCKLYVNGEEKASAAASGAINTGSTVYVSGYPSGTERWNGIIPILRVYNRGLSAAEVRQNFNSTKRRFIGTYDYPAINASSILSLDPGATDGDYWYKPAGYTGNPILCYTNFSRAPSGKGYVLVARGRESTDWWNNAGQNTTGLTLDKLNTNTPISVASGSFVNELIGGNWNLMKLLVNRINNLDSWYFQGTSSATFSWANFPSNPSSVSATATKYSSLFKEGTTLFNYATSTSWTDTLNLGGNNDCDRSFTWNWGGHGGWQGWSGGSSCTPSGSFQVSSEGHAIQLVNCYIEC